MSDSPFLIFCPLCFASEESSSWGADVMDGHCFNCGASGGTVHLPAWAISEIRKNASWVGKRYYPTALVGDPICFMQIGKGS